MTDTERGKIVKDARTNLGITQDEMAKRLNLSSYALYKYESGRNRIPIDIAGNYCKILGIKADCMLGITPDGIDEKKPTADFEIFRAKTVDWIRRNGSLSMELLFMAVWEYLNRYRPEEDRTPQIILKFLNPRLMLDDKDRSKIGKIQAIFDQVKEYFPDDICVTYWEAWKVYKDKNNDYLILWHYILQEYDYNEDDNGDIEKLRKITLEKWFRKNELLRDLIAKLIPTEDQSVLHPVSETEMDGKEKDKEEWFVRVDKERAENNRLTELFWKLQKCEIEKVKKVENKNNEEQN